MKKYKIKSNIKLGQCFVGIHRGTWGDYRQFEIVEYLDGSPHPDAGDIIPVSESRMAGILDCIMEM